MSSSNTPQTVTKTSIISPTLGHSQGPSGGAVEISQKRSNSSGGFGPASQTRHTPQPRSNQSLKHKHKSQKRSRLLDEDALAESAAMKSINSRKGQTSITHLMNFSLPPRPHHHPVHQQNHKYQRRNPTWGLGSGYHSVDKARYVHANYRFIVRPDEDYKSQAIDADVHVRWETVLQILASADTQSTNCPICLSTPVAPRMAKCGHIFCLPCLIRYMHATDDTNPLPEKRARWKKCPICEDSIYISETRPVRWFAGQEASMLQEGGDVLLRLLMREPGTTLALPRDAGNYASRGDIPWFNVAEVMDYARFMKGGGTYMTTQFDREISQLEEQEKEDELMFGDDNTWTRKAILSIEEAKQRTEDLEDPPTSKTQTVPDTTEAIPESWDQDDDIASASTSTVAASLQDLTMGQTRPTTRLTISANSTRSQPFYFYNALPNFFLSPLDIRILKVAFGDFSLFPTTILPRVEHISTGHIVDDDLRKRAKYMAHLPYGCEVSFLECDWTDIINPEVLEQFQDDLARRRKRNHEKEAREERDRVRAEKAEEQARWSSMRQRRPSSITKSFSETDFQPLVAPSASSHEDSFATTPPWGNKRTHSSFATLGSPGTSPGAIRTVWGTTAVIPQSPSLPAIPDQAPVDDGWLQGWEKDLLDEGDAVAMVEASLQDQHPGKNAVQTTSGKKGKKKKITLMSTNNRRGA